MEKIVEVLRGLEGGTTDTIYDLFFTDRRVIAAIVLHHSDYSDMYMKHNPLTSMFIGGMWRSKEINMRSGKLMDERRRAFEHMTPEEILKSHRANKEIGYEDIMSVNIRKGFLTTALEFNIQTQPLKKIKFSLKKGKIAEAERVIEKNIPSPR